MAILARLLFGEQLTMSCRPILLIYFCAFLNGYSHAGSSNHSCRMIGDVEAYFSGYSDTSKIINGKHQLHIDNIRKEMNRPSIEVWRCYYAEILYLLSTHDKKALDFAIVMMKHSELEGIYLNNLNLLFYTASWSPVFWEQVELKNKDTTAQVKSLFKKHPKLYGGLDLQSYLSN